MPPYFFLNYRVFSRTVEGEELAVVRSLEAQAMTDAVATIALSRADAEYLAAQVAPPDAPQRAPHVLLPPLRDDMQNLPPPADALAPEAAPPACSHCAVGPAGLPSDGLLAPLPLCAETVPVADGSATAPDCHAGNAVASLGDGSCAVRLPAAACDRGSSSFTAAPVGGAQDGCCGGLPCRRRFLTCCVRLSPEKEPHR